MTKQTPCYRRIILKFSGEALLGKQGLGIDPEIIRYIAAEIKPVIAAKVQVGVVIGGGNFFRGSKLGHEDISRVTADHLGMLATMLNAVAMRDIFQHAKLPTKIMSALPIAGMLELFDREVANTYLQDGYTLIFAGGTGNPLVTTDTALALRGIELDADLLLKATNVDGIYAADPTKNPQAKRYTHLTYQEALTKELAVMDLAAFSMCRDHKMQLRVYNMHQTGALQQIINGANIGTFVE